MGICLSCLGLDQSSSHSDPSESEGLLYGDQHQAQYGGISRGPTFVPPQPDPEELERERDALERLCAATSEHLIDISHLAPNEAEIAAPKMPYDYARLYAHEFGTATKETASGASTTSMPEEDETTWLDKVLDGDDIDDLVAVKPIEGGLVIMLDEVFGPSALSTSKRPT